ncbi:Aspartic proteinase nepenthesin-1 [Acorus gramineus]|uniref:Aspartic proteinase nepenthesin-1 n=1 Tax=Acorus gramineus TaxID=55184 RepID=A0AAV9A8V2_ACOGR|nr:Aspartic proteinase nepenthesin-1 [Acorus gramineus]
MAPSPSQILLFFLSAAALMLIIWTITAANLTSPPRKANPPMRGIHINITHADSARNLNQTELVRRAAARGRHRISRLRSFNLSTHDDDGDGNNEYYMEISIGSPPMTFTIAVDTGSDLFWTHCFNRSGSARPGFNPRRSLTYRVLPCATSACASSPATACGDKKKCAYEFMYADFSSTTGTVSLDTVTLGSLGTTNPLSFPDIMFGCSTSSNGSLLFTDGIAGFGRGKFSLISQLGINHFSYCLTPFGTSRLTLGDTRTPARNTVTVPLLINPYNPSFYNVALTGISVGATRLAGTENAFWIAGIDRPGVILDSGSTLTYMERSVYGLLKRELVAQARLPVVDAARYDLDLCFRTTVKGARAAFPKLVFHFDGGMDLEVTRKNYIMRFKKGGAAHCLAMVPTDEGRLTVLGSYFQRDFRVAYDLKKNLVSFTPARCAAGGE